MTAGAILTGWLVGLFVEVPNTILAMVTAFNAGALITLVVTEELPRGETGMIKGLVAGVVVYIALFYLFVTWSY